MPHVLVIREEELKRMQHYAYQDRSRGGHQNLYRKLLLRLVPLAEVEERFKQVEKDEKGLFGG